MSKYCKDCKHSREVSELNGSMLAVGILLLHVPLIFNENKLKCDNHKSVFYCDSMDEYDSCSEFESK